MTFTTPYTFTANRHFPPFSTTIIISHHTIHTTTKPQSEPPCHQLPQSFFTTTNYHFKHRHQLLVPQQSPIDRYWPHSANTIYRNRRYQSPLSLVINFIHHNCQPPSPTTTINSTNCQPQLPLAITTITIIGQLYRHQQ